jgi:hypothetical protein
MALVINNRVRETTSTTGTGAVTLGGAVGGFQTFAAGIGNDNTTYYAISINTENEWEVGLGTLNADSSTLTRTTVLESSNSDSAVDFAAGSKEVFCTLPSEKAVYLDASGDPVPAQITFKEGGTNFTGSLLVGHSTTGTLSTATYNTGVGLQTLAAITSGDYNTATGYQAGVSNTGATGNTFIGALSGANNTSTGTNTGVGYRTLWANAASGNSAVGYYASRYNSAGTGNISMGREALEGVSGNDHNYNTALGAYSNTAVTTGGYNVTLGYQSGDNITSGDGNVIIGSVDAASATGDRQLMITGYDGSTTTTWISGDSSGTVSANGGELTTTGKALVMGF